MKMLLMMLAVALPLTSLAKEKKPAAPPPAAAKAPASPELQKFLDERAALVSKTFQLNATQSAKFWPVYQQYQDGFLALGAPAERPANPDALDDAAAAKVARAFLDRDAKVTAHRAKFFPEFEKALGGKLAARFVAFDRRLWLEGSLKASTAPAAAPVAPAAPPVAAPVAPPGAVPAALPVPPPAAAPAALPVAPPAAVPAAPPGASPAAVPAAPPVEPAAAPAAVPAPLPAPPPPPAIK